MARDLGFLIHPTEREYVYLTKSITDRLLNDVRSGLGLTDLTRVEPSSPPRIIQFFTETLPNRAAKQAERWKITAPVTLPVAELLRKEGAELTPQIRADTLRLLRQKTTPLLEAAGLECGGGWSLPDRSEQDQDEEDYDEYYEDPEEWF